MVCRGFLFDPLPDVFEGGHASDGSGVSGRASADSGLFTVQTRQTGLLAGGVSGRGCGSKRVPQEKLLLVKGQWTKSIQNHSNPVAPMVFDP